MTIVSALGMLANSAEARGASEFLFSIVDCLNTHACLRRYRRNALRSGLGENLAHNVVQGTPRTQLQHHSTPHTHFLDMGPSEPAGGGWRAPMERNAIRGTQD
jgi:hypothetical protein